MLEPKAESLQAQVQELYRDFGYFEFQWLSVPPAYQHWRRVHPVLAAHRCGQEIARWQSEAAVPKPDQDLNLMGSILANVTLDDLKAVIQLATQTAADGHAVDTTSYTLHMLDARGTRTVPPGLVQDLCSVHDFESKVIHSLEETIQQRDEVIESLQAWQDIAASWQLQVCTLLDARDELLHQKRQMEALGQPLIVCEALSCSQGSGQGHTRDSHTTNTHAVQPSPSTPPPAAPMYVLDQHGEVKQWSPHQQQQRKHTQ